MAVHRITMFKLPAVDKQKEVIAAYQTLYKEQSKNGKPYVKGLVAGMATDDARAKGYTVVCKTEFTSIDDMKYFDTEDKAHDKFKAIAKASGPTEPPLIVYFEPIVAN